MTVQPEQIAVKIRLYIGGQLVDSEEVRGDERAHDIAFKALLEKHGEAITDRPHMIEIEFLDEADILQRFHRFGTDPEGMVIPIRVDEPLLFRD